MSAFLATVAADDINVPLQTAHCDSDPYLRDSPSTVRLESHAEITPGPVFHVQGHEKRFTRNSVYTPTTANGIFGDYCGYVNGRKSSVLSRCPLSTSTLLCNFTRFVSRSTV